jgi:hypothetical protein
MRFCYKIFSNTLTFKRCLLPFFGQSFKSLSKYDALQRVAKSSKDGMDILWNMGCKLCKISSGTAGHTPGLLRAMVQTDKYPHIRFPRRPPGWTVRITEEGSGHISFSWTRIGTSLTLGWTTTYNLSPHLKNIWQ